MLSAHELDITIFDSFRKKVNTTLIKSTIDSSVFNNSNNLVVNKDEYSTDIESIISSTH